MSMREGALELILPEVVKGYHHKRKILLEIEKIEEHRSKEE
jgi:hypothetical protein